MAEKLTETQAKENEGLKATVIHGINCQKAPHIRTGYLHGEDDDTPYEVDGVTYCGRCHLYMGIGRWQSPVAVAGRLSSSVVDKGIQE